MTTAPAPQPAERLLTIGEAARPADAINFKNALIRFTGANRPASRNEGHQHGQP